jgi:hypothetical protein
VTRAGEKLYGDWEKRIRRDARPVRWGRLIVNAVTLVLTLVIGGVALFGFG